MLFELRGASGLAEEFCVISTNGMMISMRPGGLLVGTEYIKTCGEDNGFHYS